MNMKIIIMMEPWIGEHQSFFDNYHGDANPVTLSEIGHLDTIQDSSETQGALGRFENQSSQLPAVAGQTAANNGVGDHPMSGGFDNGYSFYNDNMSIGGGTLTGSFDGQVTVNPDGSYEWSGITTVNFGDTFTDPYDVFNNDIWGMAPEEDWNPNGTPYDITDEWKVPMSGSGNLGYCPKND